MSLTQNIIKRVLFMGCYRTNNVMGDSGRRRCSNNDEDVLGDSGIQRIALRGPGCIDGTGRCTGEVGGAGGSRYCCFNTRFAENVQGAQGNQNGGGNFDERCCKYFFSSLITPTTVPR
jgi:hypothetical protein